MLAGELYLADDPELQADALRAAELTAEYNATAPADRAARRRILEELLGSVGEDVELRQPLRVDYGYPDPRRPPDLRQLGPGGGRRRPDRHRRRRADRPQRAAAHPDAPDRPRPAADRWEAGEPITIGDNVWLGGGVIVCPGVTIGADTVVGAGSVVTRDLPARVVAVGNPARVIRKI